MGASKGAADDRGRAVGNLVRIARSHRGLVLARVKEDVRELLQRSAVEGPATPCYWSVADAVPTAAAFDHMPTAFNH